MYDRVRVSEFLARACCASQLRLGEGRGDHVTYTSMCFHSFYMCIVCLHAFVHV